MLLDVASMLAASIGFCISSSRELEALVQSKAPSSEIALKLRKLAECDAQRLQAFTDAARAPTGPWWLLANLGVSAALLLLSPLRFGNEPMLFLVLLNALTVICKTHGSTFRNLSWTSVGVYLTTQIQLALAACCCCLPLLLMNIPFWLLTGVLVNVVNASSFLPFFPAAVQPLPVAALDVLSTAAAFSWFLWKSALLTEVLVNHAYYRKVLAKRRAAEAPSFAFHVVDSFYGFSYSIVGFWLGNAALRRCAQAAYLVSPPCWSPLGIILLLGLRSCTASFGNGVKAILYFSIHRLLHVQPFYSCWHKEHHFGASQTCLVACQDSGLLESPVEATWSQLAFVFAPFWDHCFYFWMALFNTLNHHYYEDYRHLHWRLAGMMLQLQSHLRRPLAHLEWGRLLVRSAPLCWAGDILPDMPGFGFPLAANLQYPSKDYVSAQLSNGSIDRHWHGLHHWSTEKHFGYGTYDSISKLGSGGDPDRREAQLGGFLDEYLKLRAGTVKTVSMLQD
ncbi:unnamed protein product [Symbiodinium sp. CCMP2456]|nr:unnamed protein product [Symbiodinium sp. CCMP2456]